MNDYGVLLIEFQSISINFEGFFSQVAGVT
jgi:hypothetical protein